jgi:hypothetical protein
MEHRGHKAIIFKKGSQTPIAIAKAPRVGRDVWIDDPKGKRIIRAKHRAAYKFKIIDEKEQTLAELNRAFLKRDFTIQYQKREIKPQHGIGKNGFEAYDAEGNLAFSLERHPKEKKALWLVSVGDFMDPWCALMCAYALGRVCFTHLSETRGFTLSSCGDCCVEDPTCCCVCPLLIIILILFLSGWLGTYASFFQWLADLFP